MREVKATNNFVEMVMKELDNRRIEYWQFNHCNAYIGDTQYISDGNVTHRIVPLKSYRTVVGFVDETTNDFYEYGVYSQTTSKQMTQIHNQRFRGTYRVLVEVRTYGRW